MWTEGDERMNDLQIFNYNGNEVRTIEKDGEPWWVLKDVCTVLGISKYRDTAARLDEDERESVRVDTLGGLQEMICVNESGLYSVILRSDKPEAKPFRKWVTSEVLPSIRKTGSYTVHKTNEVSFKEQVECIGIISDMLRVNDAGKLHMLNVIYKDYGLPANFLPKYEFNGSREIKSATELLKRFNLGIDTRAFNILLKENGFIEERTRRSSKDPNKQRKYKALTEKGLKYGENAISPQNQREVQPLYYADSFMELFDLVTKSNTIAQ